MAKKTAVAKAKKAKPLPRNKKLYDEGMKMRKAVLGAAYVDNSLAGAADDEFMMAFQDITTEYCWGYAWTRPGLSKKSRSMLNLAMISGPGLDVSRNHLRRKDFGGTRGAQYDAVHHECLTGTDHQFLLTLGQ